jgi:molecular chaperone GrpE
MTDQHNPDQEQVAEEPNGAEPEAVASEVAAEVGAEESATTDAETGPEGAAEGEAADTATDAIDRELEIFQDLQRLQADFVNYRARVERDRDVARNTAIADVLRAFLPALDDIARAEAHGDVAEGSPFAAVANKLRNAGDKFGLKPFGAKGDVFNPEQHDALVQTPNPEVSQAVVADVIELGYLIGDRQIRPAKVAVFVPAEQ